MDRMWAPWRDKYISNVGSTKCIFCIPKKPDPSDDKKRLILHRSEHSFVIMNKYPYNNGHIMVAPYKHASGLDLLSEETLMDMMRMINKVKKALDAAIKPHGYNIGANIGRTAGAGFDKHVHMHIVPRWNGDTNFMPVFTNVKVISESLGSLYKRLQGKIC